MMIRIRPDNTDNGRLIMSENQKEEPRPSLKDEINEIYREIARTRLQRTISKRKIELSKKELERRKSLRTNQ